MDSPASKKQARSGTSGTPRRKKGRRGADKAHGFNLEDLTAARAWEKLKSLASLCPAPESCVETALVVKDRIEGRYCMEAIDSERLHSSRSSAATPRPSEAPSFGLQRGKTAGLAGHSFGLPALDQDYVRDTESLSTGFGDKIERYIHVKTKSKRAVLTVPKAGIPPEILPGDIEKQLQSLCRVDHPNIVAFREACEDQDNLKLVYEWVDGGPLLCNLESFAEGLTESHLAEFVREVLAALAHANSLGVQHLDLCMSTIFVVTAGSFCPVKVFGLGLAGYLTALVSCREFSKSNKHYYASPEIFYTHNIKRLSPAARHASDIWAVGALLYTICSGRPPFGAGSVQELSRRVQRAMWSFGVDFAESSYVLKEAIEEMLKVPWRSRPGATSCLRMSFVEQNFAQSKDYKLGGHAMEQLLNFLQQDHCKQTVARMVTDSGLSRKAYAKLEKMFKELDLNGDGSISKAELAAAAPEIEEEQVAHVIKVLDRNGNGQLDISEFIAAVVLEQEATDERLIKMVFNKIDRDADWRLTKQEVFSMLRQYSGSLEPTEVGGFVRQMDQDGDQKVDLEEFTKLFPGVSQAEEEQGDRMKQFLAFVELCRQSCAQFRQSAQVWLRKLSQLEDKFLCACGLKERDSTKGLLSYEMGELSEYEVHLLVGSLADLLGQVPGKPKHANHRKKTQAEEDAGSKLMGVAMLGARFEAFQAQGRQPGSTHATGSSGPSGMDEFAKEVLAHQRESAATPSSFLAASLHFLIKVKSRSMWQPPVQEALLAMRQCCTSHYGEVLLKSRLDFSRCHSNLSDEYVLREGMVLPTLDSTVSIPQGARLLPVEALKGADLTSTSALRNLSDKGLPFKLVFRWDREGRPE